MHKQHQVSKKYLILLFLYGILSFIVFCALLFPKEKAIRWAFHQLSEQFNCTLATQDLHIRFPGQLELKGVKITNREAGPESIPYIYIDKIKIKPKLSQLFLKKINLLFTLHLYQGNLNGRATFDLISPKDLQDFHCSVRGIQMSDIKQLQEFFDIHLTGKLSAEARLKLAQNNLLYGTGDYTFTITPGEAQIKNFPIFTFQRIQGDGNLNQGKIKIKSANIEGDELQAQIAGDLRLNKNVTKSYLNARVHLHFSQELRGKLGALASLLPGQGKDGIHLNIKGNLDKLSFMPI